MLVLLLVSFWYCISCSLDVAGHPSAVDAFDVPIVSVAVAGFTVFASIHCVAVLLLLSFLLLWMVMILLSSLMLFVAAITVVACVTADALSRMWHSCCCWRPSSSWWLSVDGLSAIAAIVVGVFAVPFEHAVAGGPAVTGFLAVEGVLAVASVPANPGVHILAGGFTYWIVEWDVLHHGIIGLWLSNCNFFLLSNYWNIEYRIG